MEASSNQKQTTPAKKNHHLIKFLLSFLIYVGLICIVGFASYKAGYSKGELNGIKTTEYNIKSKAQSARSDALTSLPASGKVSTINKDSIKITLIGTESREAAINKDTKIDLKGKPASPSDIKVGSKVIMFTKKEGSQIIATRIIIQ